MLANVFPLSLTIRNVSNDEYLLIHSNSLSVKQSMGKTVLITVHTVAAKSQQLLGFLKSFFFKFQLKMCKNVENCLNKSRLKVK